MSNKTNEYNKNVDSIFKKLHHDSEFSGYHLNPDIDYTKDIIKGLLVNQQRYGYWACPCRLASGVKEEDLDIICPCDYRDDDLNDYGLCFCVLYVSKEIIDGKKKIISIPDRRNINNKKINKKVKKLNKISSLSKPVWRCRVCGYLCARDNPPEICPICKAKKDRFEKFIK
jgi:ferredoxin-thioredoxin reductase catalytic subunit